MRACKATVTSYIRRCASASRNLLTISKRGPENRTSVLSIRNFSIDTGPLTRSLVLCPGASQCDGKKKAAPLLYAQASTLKDKLREKEAELTAVFEACEAEKSAYEGARASANERYKAELERKTELESTVRELSVMVEQLKEVRGVLSLIHI